MNLYRRRDIMKKVILAVSVLVAALVMTGCFGPFVPQDTRGKILSVSEPVEIDKDTIQTLLNAMGIPLELIFDIEAYSITYSTIDNEGNPTVASGLIGIPTQPASSTSRLLIEAPIASVQHATIFKRSDAPSFFTETEEWGEPELGLILAGLGYVVSIADYLGLGSDDTIFHPYCNFGSLGTAIVDMLRATKNYLAGIPDKIIWNNELFLAGYSEGGYATMAATKEIQLNYSEEFSITASAPMAGPYNLSTIMGGVVTNEEVYSHLEYLIYMLYGFNAVYDIFTGPEEIMLEPYDTTVPPLMDLNHSSSQVRGALPGGGSDTPDSLLTETIIESVGDTQSEVYNALLANDLYNTWVPDVNMHMYHSSQDDAVPVENSRTAAAYFLSQGSVSFEYTEIAAGGHVEAFIPCYVLAIQWFQSIRE